MTDRESDRYHAEIDRMETEYGGELPDLNAAGGASLKQRAQRLLDCDDGELPDADLKLCVEVADW